MNIIIIGIGAMGCLFGARLSLHAQVTLIGSWPGQLRALREAPLRLVHPDGRDESIWLRATDSLASIGMADAVLILTKTPHTQAAADTAARVLMPDGLAITLQNGIGNLEILAEKVGAERAALGVTMQGAATGDTPGTVVYAGGGPTILGTHPAIDHRLRQVAALFEQAGLPTVVEEDVRGVVWGKLTVNAAINPLTALLRVLNGTLLESERARGIVQRAAREVAAVAAAQGIALPFDDPAVYAEHAARQTATNRSSMLQDVSRGAPTEIDAINGAVVRTGERYGIETPVNRMLYDLVKALEETARPDHES